LRVLIIIPTYNEADNVQVLVPRLLALSPDIEVLVVDDGSPDGTGQIAEGIRARVPRVHVLHRSHKMGLGSAYVAGFKVALEQGFDLVFEMDADLSHDPAAIPEFLKAIETADVVVGSRYLSGVTVVNWPLSRLFLSYGANLYTRIITGMPLHDATGGFKCFRRRVLEAIDLNRIRSDGYSFQIEMNFFAYRHGFRIIEIPITFTDRRAGVSKMSRRIIWEAIWMVWRLRIHDLWNRLTGRGGHAPAPAGAPGEERR